MTAFRQLTHSQCYRSAVSEVKTLVATAQLKLTHEKFTTQFFYEEPSESVTYRSEAEGKLAI